MKRCDDEATRIEAFKIEGRLIESLTEASIEVVVHDFCRRNVRKGEVVLAERIEVSSGQVRVWDISLCMNTQSRIGSRNAIVATRRLIHLIESKNFLRIGQIRI